MSAVRRAAATTKLDWSKVKAILAPQDFAQVNELRARHMELDRILTTPIPKVDVEHYRSVLANQEVVKQVEEALRAFRPRKGDTSAVMKALDAQQGDAVEKARETVEAVKSTVSGFQRDLEGIQNLAHFDHLTPDAVYEAAPGLETVYHDRLRQGKVYHDDHNFGEKFFG